MDNIKRRNTYIFWAIAVILASILATYVKNTYTQVIQMVVAVYALYRLLKMDNVFDPKKRRALRKAQLELRRQQQAEKQRQNLMK